jgi:integrase
LKTANSRRTVPLPQSVADALAAHLAEFGPGREGFIFTAPEGGPVRGTRFREVWRRTLQSAGMVRVRPHDLRHFYASLLIDAGESVKVVQDRLGHASATVTLDTYGHLWPNSEERTRAAVDRVLLSSAVSDRCHGEVTAPR